VIDAIRTRDVVNVKRIYRLYTEDELGVRTKLRQQVLRWTAAGVLDAEGAYAATCQW
jgi:hypothetical protein